MYIHSSNKFSLKISMSKTEADQLLLNKNSREFKRIIISAILSAALHRSKFKAHSGIILIKFCKNINQEYILEFKVKSSIKNEQTLYCYKVRKLSYVKKLLRKLMMAEAKITKLYNKNHNYYLLSEKVVQHNPKIVSKHIEAKLNEYAKLISENACEEIYELL